MVEMYVWLLVTLVVAVGVLMLAGIVSPGDSDDTDDADDARGTPTSAWSSLWRDFLSGTSTLRARWARLRHRAGPGTGPDASPHRVSVLAGDDTARPGRVPAPTAPTSDAGAAETSTSWRDLDPAESNTSFEEFFEATATSEPAYLDAAQLSDTLNSLRR